MIKRSIILVALLAAGCTTNLAGRSQMLLYSDSEMDNLGVASFEELKKTIPKSKNKAQTTYVKCVADKIIVAIGDNPKNWEVVLFNSKEVNAFALPGKKIGVYTGILEVANTPDQLATVLGHEVAHVLANHGNEKVSRGQAADFGLSLANIGMQIAGVGNSDLYMQGLSATTQIGLLLPFSRAQESEADSVGLEFMAKAGFNPNESITLWENMGKLDGGGFSLLSTHPSSSGRAEDLAAGIPKVTPYYLNAKNSKPKCKAP